jgi:hypothetical protein
MGARRMNNFINASTGAHFKAKMAYMPRASWGFDKIFDSSLTTTLV